MTTSLDLVTSELPDVNISINFNITTVAGSPAGRMSQAIPMIVRVAILLILQVINLCGNGFTLITIRMTRKLWTKTNFILASMLCSNVITAFITFWYNPFLLVVYVFNNPCHFNVVVAALTPLMKMVPYASIYHLILISMERYIAIVYPLHYEFKFTDRTLKWALFIVWATGILVGMTYALWLINADHRRCILIPPEYHLVDLLAYTPVCICLFTCYGKILAISWRQHRRIEPQPANVNRAPGPSPQTIAVANATQSNQSSKTTINVQLNDRSVTHTGAPSVLAVTSGTASEPTQELQRQKIKSRRHEFKAVYLTAAIVGTFVILWFPHALGRVLESVGYNPLITSYISRAGGAIGAANFAFSWVIYAAVSKSYRRAYRQMLIHIGCCGCKNVTLPTDN